MLSQAELSEMVRKQQPRGSLYPLEVFCRHCGRGHLATPRWERATCRDCDAPLKDAAFREFHP